MFDVTEDIKYVGVDDLTLDLFEGQYVVPDGVSYNSYVCLDEKTAVFDTVDDRKTEEWLENLENVLGGRLPDYLVVSHVEPDHSASVPAFLKKYPSAAVVGNEKTFILLNRFYGDIPNKVVVKEGDELSLGRHKLTFLFAPMVHWPEVMMTFDKTAGVLYSADAFGKFGALSRGGEWSGEARRYYINIVGKYGNSVRAVLKKAEELNIGIICPLHGPVLKDDLSGYLKKYALWSAYAPEEKGVLVAYASIYGNTAEAAEALAKELTALGVETRTADLTRCDLSQAVAEAFKYSALVCAGVTYDGGILPCMETFINRLKAKNYCGRKVGFIQNGSWAPAAARVMRSSFENLKDISFCETVVTVNSAMNAKAEEELLLLAKEFVS